MQRYRDYNTYLRRLFGERVQKIPLDAGLSCPNRDGSLSRDGCVYCDARGSGTGALKDRGLALDAQISQGRDFLRRRYRAHKFIAYFQSFSNTYAPPARLKTIFDHALQYPDIVGLAVATRPDCLDDDVLALLHGYRDRFLVWLELGLQSAHDATLRRINRGHDVACFERGLRLARKWGLNVCAHIILGLPGETRAMMLATADYLAALPLQGVKIHALYVNRGTRLAQWYRQGLFACLEREAYVRLVVDCLEMLPAEVIVQRLTGDPVPSELLAPLWALEKTHNLERIRAELEARDTWQGRRVSASMGRTGARD